MLTEAVYIASNSYDVATPSNGGILGFLFFGAILLVTRKGWQK